VIRGPSPADVYIQCPVAVRGAHVELQDVERGVVFDVTGDDAPSLEDIRGRTAALLAIAAERSRSVRTWDEGDAHGLERCPIVVHDDTVTANPIDRGMRIVVVTGIDRTDWLRHESRARLTELLVPATAVGVGLDHCPSALVGTTTTVRDSAEGVVVTIVSSDTAIADAVRARAWHMAEQSRRGTYVEHAADASASRRCPISLCDTDVDAKDVAGGSQVAVRARMSGEAVGLRREARARAEAFR
jgi:TusA-related sulfurtransferase